ncbi:hypothetical protein GGTG_03110 [Gaeumannomyces tritici R3-111a-1]|uniref:Uncharacterized protein n=1 Tax=Gaeumannomyces tritici (strain R3-111a-1) TaxID=644352 RepID=J3NPA4_GAET3|nr:hypothetical protein GGTG_03110 [Gaeumannomyces tritici R3-111a-1]EJT78007.1 hypothetical protein GGTG_03110 [Gaeumannomyces tritici R3-111a-1]
MPSSASAAAALTRGPARAQPSGLGGPQHGTAAEAAILWHQRIRMQLHDAHPEMEPPSDSGGVRAPAEALERTSVTEAPTPEVTARS